MFLSNRLFLVVSTVLWLLTMLITPAKAQGGAGSSDDSFRPVIERRTIGLTSSDIAVYALAEQSDGKILVGGAFNALGGTAQNGIARLNADGSMDGTFNDGSGIGGIVQAIAVQPDGKILIGGSFTTVNGTSRNSLARLNSDGSLDTPFNVGTGADNSVLSIAAQPDGKIVIGGFFNTFNGSSRPGIARLNADGTLDNTVTAQFNSSGRFVFAVALQSDGKILVGGNFDNVNGSPQNGIARLNADGSLDGGFAVGSGVDLRIRNFVLQPDSKIIVVGDFTQYNGISRRSIARLNPNGSLDMTFEAVNNGSTFNDGIYAADLQPDGKIIVGGRFTNFGANLGRIARLNANGSLDTAFIPTGNFSNGFDAEVYAVRRLANSRISVGGFFTTFSTAAGSTQRNKFARLSADGTLDTSFQKDAGTAGINKAIAAQPDGKIVIGGTFDFVNGVSRNSIARLNADGSADASFIIGAGFDGQGFTPIINAVAVQPDGKILAAGLFAFYDGQTTQRGIIRLNADGSRDTTFNLGSVLNGTVNAILIQPDGKILIGGSISSYFGREGIVRLNANGSTDTSFNGSGFNIGSRVSALARQADGKLLIGGSFNAYNSQPVPTVIRVSVNGTRDGAFAPSVGSEVSAIAVQTDGKIVIGGLFTSVGGTPQNHLARLNSDGTPDNTFNTGSGATGTNATVNSVTVQSNGNLLIGGNFAFYNGVSRSGLARVNRNGSLDGSFAVGAGIENRFPESVFVTTLQADGKFLIGGSFTRFNGTARSGLVRVLSPPSTPYDFDGDGRADLSVFRPSSGTWYLNRSTAGFSAVNWGLANDTIVPADYDGDGRTDVAVYRGGTWYIVRSSDGGTYQTTFGLSDDIPVPADFDGDGRADISVYRPSDGTWYRLNSSNGQYVVNRWGVAEDKPAIGDFDGDGKADLCVYRPSEGNWYLLGSATNQFSVTRFGAAEDLIVPADYDGDGKTDIAVYRPSTSVWDRLSSTDGTATIVAFGISTDKPVPADYDGDGKADIAVYRDGTWYILNSGTPQVGYGYFGTAEDRPLPNAYVR